MHLFLSVSFLSGSEVCDQFYVAYWRRDRDGKNRNTELGNVCEMDVYV